MSTGDRVTILVGAAAICATLGVGSCSTNARIDDLNRNLSKRFDDLNHRFGGLHHRFDDLNHRFDDVNGRIDGLRADIRELRLLLVDALADDEPAN